MLNLRALCRVAALVLLLLACLLPHLVSRTLRGRSPWPPRFLAAAAWIIGARARVHGPAPKPRTLLLANHLSWLDILVLGGATGCAFVSKDDLGHGVIHWLADQNRTIYVDRSALRSVHSQAAAIGRALEGERIVALFPEGTVGPGDQLLPFKPTLLSVAAPAPAGVTVQPVAIDYGHNAQELRWLGEPTIQNVRRILGRRGSFPVAVRLLDPLPTLADRKQLAWLARERIAAALFASSSHATRL